jgi:hypothetical protein
MTGRTLKELDVKPGDVVQAKGGNFVKIAIGPSGEYLRASDMAGLNSTGRIWCLVSRATPPSDAEPVTSYTGGSPSLWRDMTPEQKGALLLAHHEKPGSVEFWNVTIWETLKGLGWMDDYAYRIKPEPKREAVTMVGGQANGWGFYQQQKRAINTTHRITFDTIDGKPDPASIKMEELDQ